MPSELEYTRDIGTGGRCAAVWDGTFQFMHVYTVCDKRAAKDLLRSLAFLSLFNKVYYVPLPRH